MKFTATAAIHDKSADTIEKYSANKTKNDQT